MTDSLPTALPADAPPAHPRAARARVETPNAARYMKALCNHFERKVPAQYDGTHGVAHFSFGTCEMDAQPDALLLHIAAEDETAFERVKHVVEDHLVRFGSKENLQIAWVEATAP